MLAAFQEFLAARSAPSHARSNADMWASWYPTVEGSARGPNIRTHRRYIIDLQFVHDGRTLTLGELTAEESTAPVIEAWRARLRTVRGHRGAILAPAYRDQIRLSLQAMWTYHVDIGELRKNPMKGIPREDGWEGRRREGYLNDAQLERFLPHCRPILGAMLKLSYRCGGLRRDEMRLLKKSEVDWDNREIVLAGERTKSGEPRRVLLTEDGLALVHAFATVSPSEYVFAHPGDPEGKPVPKSTLWTWLEDARQSAKLTLAGEPVVIHSARHGFTMRMQGRAPEAWIADQLGHRDTTMIAERYGRLRGRDAREEMRQMMERERTPLPERKPPAMAARPVLPQKKTTSGP